MQFLVEITHKVNKEIKNIKIFENIFTVVCTKEVAKIDRHVTWSIFAALVGQGGCHRVVGIYPAQAAHFTGPLPHKQLIKYCRK